MLGSGETKSWASEALVKKCKVTDTRGFESAVCCLSLWSGSLKCDFRFDIFLFQFFVLFWGTAHTPLNTLQPLFYWRNIISNKPEKGNRTGNHSIPDILFVKIQWITWKTLLSDIQMNEADFQPNQQLSNGASCRLTPHHNLPVNNTEPELNNVCYW